MPSRTPILVTGGAGFIGANFVHDWLALAVVIVVCGHTYMAFSDSTARLGMRTGSVPVTWAEREHAAWVDEELGASDPLDASE